MASLGGRDSSGRWCLRSTFMLCFVILVLSTSLCFYYYNQLQGVKGTELPHIKSILSYVIQMNSTHVNSKLLERVNVEWDRNIYFSVKTRWGLFYGTERNGTERNDGLNYGTERFLKLKLATYHC